MYKATNLDFFVWSWPFPNESITLCGLLKLPKQALKNVLTTISKQLTSIAMTEIQKVLKVLKQCKILSDVKFQSEN